MDVNDPGPSDVSRGHGEDEWRSSILARLDGLEAFKTNVLHELAGMRSLMEKILTAYEVLKKMAEEHHAHGNGNGGECAPTGDSPVQVTKTVNERSSPTKENEDLEAGTSNVGKEVEKEKVGVHILRLNPN